MQIGNTGLRAGRRGLRCAAGALALTLSAGLADVRADDATSRIIDAANAAEMRKPISFHIAPQPLASAIVAYSKATDLDVVFSGPVGAGIRSPGVSGSFTPEAALKRLLQGAGLTATLTGPRTITLLETRSGGDPEAIELREIAVEAQAERASGPTRSYVAKRSATGAKTDTPIVEIPQSISVVPRQQIEAQAARTVSETLRYTPGVVSDQYGGTDLRIDQYLVRGFANSFPYLDGLTTNTHYTLLSPKIDPYGLERVEILRGPASVLYGQNVPGGLINLVSKRPTSDPLAEVEASLMSPLGAQAAFDVGGPVNKDGTLLYRLTALGVDRDTQVDHVDNKRFFIAPAVTYAPSDDTRFTVLANVQHSDDGVLVQNLPALGTLHKASFGRIPTDLSISDHNFNNIKRTSEQIGYQFEHRFNDVWTVRQNLRYGHSESDIRQTGTFGYVSPAELSRWSLAAKAHVDDFAVDNQAQADFNTGPLRHTALFGLDYFRSHDRWVERDGEESPLDVIHPVRGVSALPPIDYATDDLISQVGAYAQDQIKWDRWVFTAGVRHDWSYTRSDDILAKERVADRAQAWTGRVGLVYLFDNGLAPYVSYSSSFQPTVGDPTQPSFKPTTGRQWEAGVKYQLPGYDSFVMLSAFTIDQRNVLTPSPTLENPNRQVQTGGVRVRGIEASGVADLAGGLKLIGAYTYTDSEITKDLSGNAGNRLKDVPKHMASLWLDKTIVAGAFKGFGAGLGLRYVGGRYGENENTIRLPSNFFVDGSIHYDRDHWRFSINAKNLLDKKYVATCDSAEFCYYGQRREVLGTVAYRW